jgi:hypothetical protein
MKPGVYVESSVPSYLAAHPSRDRLLAAHQQATHEWWGIACARFKLWVSELVLQEIRRGDPDAAARRVAYVAKIPVLELTDDVRALAGSYQIRFGMPYEARVDLTHVAIAVLREIDYLVTWNCAHIANPAVIRKLAEDNREHGRFTPLILTPEAFLNLLSGATP